MSGTVSISRDLFDHGTFKDEPFSEREAWIWMIMEARWKAGKSRAGDYVVDLARGEFAASVRYMAKAWDWTPAKVQRYLERLKKCEMITSKTDTGVSVITVCNYDKFQPQVQPSDTGPIQVRYGSDTKEKKDVIREEGGDEKREAKASSKKRATRLPDDWYLPKAWGEWAVSEGYASEIIRSEADNFKDYWKARAGPTASKLDWEATWRIWMRKSPKHNSPRKSENAKFGAAIHQLADHLSAGTTRIDLASRDPFAVRPGPNPAPDEQRSFPLLRP